ncbi:MAG: DUF885 domain-containing protein [Fimbriiglobus sp.]
MLMMWGMLAMSAVAQVGPEDAKLAGMFQKYLEEEFRRHPSYATQQGNHEYDDRLDDLSPQARAEDLQRAKALLVTLGKEIDKTKLSRAGQIDLEIWMHSVNYSIWQAENTDDFANDPRVYINYISDSVFSLFTQSTLPRGRNVANAARRITYIPKIVAAAKLSIKNPPRILTEIAIKRTIGAITFYEKEIYALAQETPTTSELAAPSKEAVKALQDFQKFLETEVLPKSTGEWRLGKAKFGAKLLLELDAGITADELLKTAESEAVRVEQEMYYVSKQLWSKQFPGQALPPDDVAGRRECIRKVLEDLGKDHGTSESFVGDARASVTKIKDFIRTKKILTLPEPDTCQIIEMPEFQRGFSAAYLNPAPPFDPKANSLYAIAPPPSDWPATRQKAFFQEYNKAMLQILTIHEAYPGHYVQLEYGNRNPSLIRKVLYSGVFAEGWAVYTEQMMLDQGYGDGDLSLRLHQLKFYIRAVLNAILDNKMHCSNMTDDEAKSLLMERGFQTEGEAVGKIQRAKQSSCQLSTYFTGRLAFYNLRQSVSRKQGDKFNLGAFHEATLSHGTLPVKYLAELVK